MSSCEQMDRNSARTIKVENQSTRETKAKTKLPIPQDKDIKTHSEKKFKYKVQSSEKALMSCATCEKPVKAKSSKDDQRNHRKNEDREKKDKNYPMRFIKAVKNITIK